MTSATSRPTMTERGVISRMCGRLERMWARHAFRESMQETGCVSYWIPCSMLSGTRCRMRSRRRPPSRDQALVLIGVEVHAIDAARRRHGPRVEELALALSRNGGQCGGQSRGLPCGALELRRDCALGLANWRRRDDQDRGHGHARLDRRLADRLDQRRETLR